MIKDLNDLAVAVSALERGAVNLSVAQIKEVLRCLGDTLRHMPLPEALRLVGRLMERPRKTKNYEP